MFPCKVWRNIPWRANLGGGGGIIRVHPRGESNFEQRNFCRPYEFFVVFILFTHSTISHQVHNFDRGKRETRYIVELLSLGFGDSHSSREYTGICTWHDIQMNKRVINILLLSAALGWVMPVMAQDSSLESISVGEPIKIYPASIPRNMLWSVITLISPGDEYRPIPLYIYKGLNNEIIFNKIRNEAAKGNVHIAAVRNLSGGSFWARGIQISSDVEWREIERKIRDEKEWKDKEWVGKEWVGKEWKDKKWKKKEWKEGEWAFAFTRLLAPQIIDDPGNEGSGIVRSEYFTSPKLWQNLDKNPLKQ